MSCGNLQHFPKSLPKDTEGIVIYEMEADSIHTNLFKMAPNLEKVEIYFGKIGIISKGSFSNISHALKDISFFQSQIRIIETGAFNDIPSIKSVSFHNVSIGEIQGDGFSKITNLEGFSMTQCNVTVVRENALNFISKVGRFQISHSHFGLVEVNALNNFGSIDNFAVHENTFKMFKCMSLEPLLTNANSSAFFKNIFSCSCDLQWMVRDKVTHSFLYSNWCEKKDSGTKINLDDYDFKKAACSEVNDSCTEQFSVTIATPKTTTFSTTKRTTVVMETHSERQTLAAFETTYPTTKANFVPTSRTIQTEQITKFEPVGYSKINLKAKPSASITTTNTIKTQKSITSQSVTYGNIINTGSQERATRQRTTDVTENVHTKGMTVSPQTQKPKVTSIDTNGADSAFFLQDLKSMFFSVLFWNVCMWI